jgi:hypothetical protein
MFETTNQCMKIRLMKKGKSPLFQGKPKAFRWISGSTYDKYPAKTYD